MDLTAYSSVGTQTPTEERSFEYPEVFSPAHLSRSAVSSSSIGTQTGVRIKSFESPEATSSAFRSSHRSKLFRRHSTGSDVYNFSSSPTLLTAFGGMNFMQRGGILSQRLLLEESVQALRNVKCADQTSSEDASGDVEVESVGQQLRKIGDDFDRKGSFRSRSLSVSGYLVNLRRRGSSSSASSSSTSSS